MVFHLRSMRAEKFRSLTVGGSLIAAFLFSAPPAGAGEKQVDFAKEIQPILAQSCNRCHGGSDPQKRPAGNLRLDDPTAAMKGGKSGPAILPGKAKDSLLYKLLLGPVKVKGHEIPLMPKTWGGGGPGGPGGPGGGPGGPGGGPKGPGGPGGGQGTKGGLPKEKIELIKKWIDQGAKWPKDAKAAKEGEDAGEAKDGEGDREDPDAKGGTDAKGSKDAKEGKVAKSGKDAKVDFAKDIQPILAESCVRCHGAPDAKDPRKKSSGGLRLDDLAAAIKGGKSGKAILPGKAKDSLLYKLLLGPAKVGGREISGMPKARPGDEVKLASEKVELIRLWIDQGARPSAPK